MYIIWVPINRSDDFWVWSSLQYRDESDGTLTVYSEEWHKRLSSSLQRLCEDVPKEVKGTAEFQVESWRAVLSSDREKLAMVKGHKISFLLGKYV